MNRASLWNYKKKSIICANSFNNIEKKYNKGDVFFEKDFPEYFNAFTQGVTLVVNDICKNAYTKDFCAHPLNDIKSLLDIPIFSRGELVGVICFETISDFKVWSDEDVNFARSISDIISISFEAQRRKKAEKQLLFRSEILGAIAKTTEKLLLSKNIQATITETLQIIGNATKVDRLSFYEFDTKNQFLNIKSHWLSQKYKSQKNTPLPDILRAEEMGAIFKNLTNNKSFFSLINSSNHDVISKIFANQNVLSILILPIIVKNELYGV